MMATSTVAAITSLRFTSSSPALIPQPPQPVKTWIRATIRVKKMEFPAPMPNRGAAPEEEVKVPAADLEHARLHAALSPLLRLRVATVSSGSRAGAGGRRAHVGAPAGRDVFQDEDGDGAWGIRHLLGFFL
jgi:hypothetical protein